MANAESVDDVNDEVLDLLEVGVTNRAARVKDEEHVDAVALAAARLQLLTETHEVRRVATRTVVVVPEVALTFDVARNVRVLRLQMHSE